MHDPVTPMVVQPGLIGWEAKNRRIDLTIERAFSGEELVKRMKGWVTIDPGEVVDIVKRYGKLRVLDDWELVIEFERPEKLDGLQQELSEVFHGEVDIEPVKKKS